MNWAGWREWSPGMRIAAVCLAGALLLDLAVLARMRHVRDDVAVVPLHMEQAPRITTRIRSEAQRVREASLRTPFDVVPAAVLLEVANALAQPNSLPLVRPRLVGTVVEGENGGFVVVEMPDARMQLVRIGERAGELRLRSVAAGEAVFDDLTGGRVTLRTPRAGSGVEPRP